MHPYATRMTGMEMFLLEPRLEQIASPRWASSDIRPTRVWILAKDRTDARQRMTAITAHARTARLGDESPMPPWESDELVSCEPNNTHKCREGEALTEDGRILCSND